MLKQRILTALVLIPLVIAGVLMLPTVWFGILFGLILLMAGSEWSKLVGLVSPIQLLGFFTSVAVGVLAVVWVLFHGVVLWPLFLLISLWWVWTAVRIVGIREICAPIRIRTARR